MIQNFADGHLPIVGGAIVVPTSEGVYAFVDAGDIAAIAVETPARPEALAGAVYAPAWAAPLTVAEVAAILSKEIGRGV